MSFGPFAMPDPRSWTARLASALPDLALSAGCAVTWARPDLVAPWVPRWILLTMLLEFIVVHSSGFMGVFAFGRQSKREVILATLGLGALYSLFAAGFSLGFHTWWPFTSFWLLTLNRLTGSLLYRDPDDDGSAQGMFMAGWALSSLCYLLGVTYTSAADLPRLGFDARVVASLHLEGGGLWVDEPWRVVAFGAVYFGVIGLLELLVFPLLARRRRASSAARRGPMTGS
jgi:hypothetical protein